MLLFSPANSIQETQVAQVVGTGGIYIGGTTTIYCNFPTIESSECIFGEFRLNRTRTCLYECAGLPAASMARTAYDS